MSDPYKKLQTNFSDILKDLMSMSVDVVKKSNILLDEVDSLDELSASNVAAKLKKLLGRMNTNLDSFIINYDSAIKNYQDTCENNNAQNSIPKDSVQKNGAIEETDVDLTQSDEESIVAGKTKKIPKNGSPKPVIDDVSDSESEKTILNFDVPVKSSMQGLSDCDDSGDELYKALDQLDKLSDAKNPVEAIKKQEQVKRSESGSFDFDEDDDELKNAAKDKLKDGLESDGNDAIKAVDQSNKLNEEKDKLEATEEEQKKSLELESFDFDDTDESPEKMGQTQKDNLDLLDLLNRAIGGEEARTEDSDCDAALAALEILDAEVPLSSDSLSDDDDDDISMKSFSKDDRRSGDFETDGNVSDIESGAEDPQPEFQLKSCDINLEKRLDEMDDAEIARLCYLQNINKRKCVKDLKKHRRRKLKRIRLMSSSSSSSSISLSSTGSSTPDLIIDTQRSPSPLPSNIELPDDSALADELLERLEKEDLEDDDDDDEDIELSSETNSDLESESKKKENEKPIEEQTDEQHKEQVKDEPPDINAEQEEKKQKKRGTWRDEIFFDTSSTDSDIDPVVIHDDPLEERVEIEEDDDDSKEKMKFKVANDGVTMIITDSDESNSDSDDVTFVDEVLNDESSGPRGRRNIRSILSDNELSELTQKAKYEEDERIMRLEERSKTIETIKSQHEEFVLDVDVNSGEPLVTVDYKLAKVLKPHQREGVRFMWEACYESVEILRKEPGTGCILAHCMGLGKTLQVVALVHALFKHPVTKTKHVLITCPLSTVTNWGNEFKSAFKKLSAPCNIPGFFMVKGDIREKIRMVNRWREVGGVLTMGYETFTMLTNENMTTRVGLNDKEKISKALLDPGPDLIVCDEGHQLKNEKTLRTKALMRVKTKRRIVLTGTPLQNNLKEYYYMVEFVKPHLLGTSKEYTNRFATPIQNGQYHNSTPEDIKLMKKRTHVLTKLLKKTIHRVEVGVLSSYLPEIVDYTIFIKLTPLQVELYTNYIKMVTSQGTELGKGFFADIMMLNFNNLHPYTIQLYYNKPKPKRKKKKAPEEQTPDDDQDEDVGHVKQDWYKTSLPEDVATNADYSAKLKVVLDIVDESARMGDKVLIFAQKLVELDLLEIFFKGCRSWLLNIDYYRMDGRTSVDSRDHLCKRFNSNPACKVFLLTHKVGGLGLNLTGANRVIMIGSNHNPSLDTQSMYRIYRFGQTKKCYVYRLLSLATMEEKIYRRCVVKLHLSGTVVDKLHYTRKFMSTDVQEMYKLDFDQYLIDRPIPAVPHDKLLATLLQNIIDIYRYHPHNSLLENRPEEELTDEDKKLAWDEFNSMEEAARASSSTMVPNPMNSNVRGFIPRGLLTNGTRHQNPTNANTSSTFHHNMHQQYPFSLLTNSFTPRVGTPAPRNATTPQLRGAASVAPSHSSNFNPWVGNPGPSTPRVSAHANAQHLVGADPDYPASEVLRNLRQNIAKIIREHPRPRVPDEAASSGEFNYALNKVV